MDDRSEEIEMHGEENAVIGGGEVKLVCDMACNEVIYKRVQIARFIRITYTLFASYTFILKQLSLYLL